MNETFDISRFDAYCSNGMTKFRLGISGQFEICPSRTRKIPMSRTTFNIEIAGIPFNDNL